VAVPCLPSAVYSSYFAPLSLITELLVLCLLQIERYGVGIFVFPIDGMLAFHSYVALVYMMPPVVRFVVVFKVQCMINSS
jgi:hypothetical protein